MALDLKDVSLATAAGEKGGRRMPMLDALRAQMTAAVDAGLADKDWSAVAQFIRQR
jgi:3-hydroxyisobutyrate dehydrogenase-like beta-hydroxyacid dehydrogenase